MSYRKSLVSKFNQVPFLMSLRDLPSICGLASRNIWQGRHLVFRNCIRQTTSISSVSSTEKGLLFFLVELSPCTILARVFCA